MQANKDDIDPAKYAGESWYATEEYARPDDIENPWTRGEVGKEGDYYPPPAPPRPIDKKFQKRKSLKQRMAEKMDKRTLMERMMDEGKI
jgi:hypothetical protein